MTWPNADISGALTAMTLAEELTLTGDAVAVTLTIPSGRGRLVRAYGVFAFAAAGRIQMQINGNTGSVYVTQRMEASGASESIGRSGSSTLVFIAGVDGDADSAMMFMAELFGARDIIKGFSLYVGTTAASIVTDLGDFHMAAAGPITSLRFFEVSENLRADSMFMAEGVGDD